MFTLPQGCSAKREIILDETTSVQIFIYIRFYLIERAEGSRKPNDFSGNKQKRRPVS